MSALFGPPRPVRRISAHPDKPIARRIWPATLPPIAQVLTDGLDLAQVTILVGENGSGKSTLVEAIAMAFGLSPEGGSTGAQHTTRTSESILWQALRLERAAGASRWGYFLRAETMHGLFTYLENNPGPGPDPEFHHLSHGEALLAMLAARPFRDGGLFVLDEPEAGLSFSGQLTLLGGLLDTVRAPRAQVIMATHSPILAAMPQAQVLQMSSAGITPVDWAELDVVDHYRRFLAGPDAYLRHLTG